MSGQREVEWPRGLPCQGDTTGEVYGDPVDVLLVIGTHDRYEAIIGKAVIVERGFEEEQEPRSWLGKGGTPKPRPTVKITFSGEYAEHVSQR